MAAGDLMAAADPGAGEPPAEVGITLARIVFGSYQAVFSRFQIFGAGGDNYEQQRPARDG